MRKVKSDNAPLLQILIALIFLTFGLSDHAAQAEAPPQKWQPYSAIRAQVRTIAPASVVKLEFFGQMLLGCYPGSIIVKDPALIAAIIGGLKEAEYRKPAGKPPVAFAQILNNLSPNTPYSFAPESAAGVRLYFAPSAPATATPASTTPTSATAKVNTVRAMTFPFVPGTPELSYGPKFVAALKLLGPSYVASIRETVRVEAANVVEIKCEPLGIENTGEPPIRDGLRIETILTVLQLSDERIFSAVQGNGITQRCLAPRLTLIHRNGRQIPIFLVIAVPDDLGAAPEWLRTLCDQVSQ